MRRWAALLLAVLLPPRGALGRAGPQGAPMAAEPAGPSAGARPEPMGADARERAHGGRGVGAKPWAALGGAARARLWAELKKRPLPDRLVGVSERFLGTPYRNSPLGEGEGPDPDPLFRYDAVDCLTFVEETLALSLAPRFEEAEEFLSQLRYGQEPTYQDRNHLMEAEWLPRNQAKGFVHDVTRQYATGQTEQAFKVLNEATWRSPQGRALGLPLDRQLKGRFPLTIIPLPDAEKAVAAVPSGTILLVVREDAPTKITRISHLGFIVRDGGRVLVRHATKGWLNAVVDEELGHFLGRIQRHNETEPRKVVGVSLYQVDELPPAREISQAGAAP